MPDVDNGQRGTSYLTDTNTAAQQISTFTGYGTSIGMISNNAPAVFADADNGNTTGRGQ